MPPPRLPPPSRGWFDPCRAARHHRGGLRINAALVRRALRGGGQGCARRKGNSSTRGTAPGVKGAAPRLGRSSRSKVPANRRRCEVTAHGRREGFCGLVLRTKAQAPANVRGDTEKEAP